jgi:uncharacterized RDD family membrane protein YckC
MKKLLVLLVVLILLVSTFQMAFAAPPGPVWPSCNMGHSWWEPGTGPGNAYGVEPGQRGMYRVHNNSDHPRGYTNGASHMDIICPE